MTRRDGQTRLMEIRSARPGDAARCVAVVAALPEYFTPSTHQDLTREVAAHSTWVAEQGDEVIGFVVAPRRFNHAAEITFAAVVPDLQHNGIGTALVERSLEHLATQGVGMVEVKTLDSSAGYEPYVAARAFWERRGFVQIDCIDPLPG